MQIRTIMHSEIYGTVVLTHFFLAQLIKKGTRSLFTLLMAVIPLTKIDLPQVCLLKVYQSMS